MNSQDRLDKFLDYLRNSGFTVQTIWQELTTTGRFFELCLIEKDRKWVEVLFNIYPDSKGYSTYILSKDNDIRKDVEAIEAAMQ